METDAYMTIARADGRALIDAAATGWDRPVEHCPGWDAAELVRHTGHVLVWMTAIVGAGGERVSRRALPPAPESTSDLEAWFATSLDGALDAFVASGPVAEVWTFSGLGDHRITWLWRRLGAELAVHRWDAEHAVGRVPAPVDGDLAAAGIEEFVTEFVPGLLSGDEADLSGTVHLHATDGSCEWLVDLGAKRAEPVHAKGDVAVRGTRSDLLLWLSNRSADVEVLGDATVAESWSKLRF